MNWLDDLHLYDLECCDAACGLFMVSTGNRVHDDMRPLHCPRCEGMVRTVVHVLPLPAMRPLAIDAPWGGYG